MSDGEFGVRIPIEISLSQTGLGQVTQEFKQSLEQIASAGVAGSTGGIPAAQQQVELASATYLAAARNAVVPEGLVGPELAAAEEKYREFGREVNSVTRQITASMEAAGAASKEAVASIAESGSPAVNASLFQRLQAFTRGNAPENNAPLGQFLGQRALSLGGYAVSAAAFYGTFTAIRNAVTEANAFQQAMVILQKTMQATDDAGEFPQTRQAILDLSDQFGVAGSQVAQITTVFRGAFGDTTRAVTETKNALELATATGLSIGEVTNTVLAVDEAFNTTSKSIGDVTLSLQELTGVSAKETITALGQVAPVADQIGLSLKQTASLFALSEQLSGRSGQTIAENFNRILPAIQKNGVAILDLIHNVPSLGKEYQALGSDLNAGSEGKFFVDLVNVFGKLGPVAQNTIIELLGNRREAGALIPVLQNAAKYNDLVAKSSTNNGKTAQYASAQLATLSKQLGILKTNLQNIIGDLFRAGLASGFTDALKVVEVLIGGLQQVESVLKDINSLTHGVVGQLAGLAVLYGAFKGGSALVSGVRNVGGGGPLVAGATKAADILVAGATKAADALVAGGETAAAEQSAGGARFIGGAGGITDTTAPVAAAEDPFLLAAATAPAGTTLAETSAISLPVLPLAIGAFAGFTFYKQVVDASRKANQEAADQASKFVDKWSKQNSELEQAIVQFGEGNRTLSVPSHIRIDQLSTVANAAALQSQSKSIQDFIDQITKQAQDQFYDKAPKSSPGGGGLFIDPSNFINLIHKIPGIPGRGTKIIAQDYSTQFSKIRDDIRKKYTKDVFIPFIDQYIKNVQDGTAAALSAPGQKGAAGVSQVFGANDIKIPSFDVKGRAAAASQEEIAQAKAQLEIVRGLLKDGTKKSFEAALKYLDAAQNNPLTGPSVKKAFTDLQNQVKVLQRTAQSNDVEADIATQQELYQAGYESATKFIRALKSNIKTITDFKGVLTPQLQKELADYQKQLADVLNNEASQAENIALLGAGDDPVKQAEAKFKFAQKAIQDDITLYRRVLPKDAAAYFAAYDDLLFAKAQAAEAEKEQALNLAIQASKNPAVRAELEKALADTQKAYAAQIGKIPGHGQAAKDAANQAAQTGIQATQDAQDSAQQIAQAQLDLLSAMTQDPVQLAQIAIQQADVEAKFAQGTAAKLEAAAHKLQAQHQLADAISAEKDAFDQLLTALANFFGNTIEAANISVAEAIRHLQEAVAQGKGKAVIDQDRAAVVNALAQQRDSVLQSKEDTIAFNLELKKISTAQAIGLYTALLSSKNTVQEQRDLLEKINSLKQTLNQDLQFNLPTDLTLPTLYEARRFLQGGGAGGFASTAAVQNNDNRQITINVNGAGDPGKVAKEVVSALSGPNRYGTRPRMYP